MTTTIKQDSRPTRAELVDRAVQLKPFLRNQLKDSDIHRQQSDEVIETLTAAGFFKLNKPRQFGGYPIDSRTTLEITEALCEADASAGWVVALAATGSWCTTHGSEQMQQEVFADPDVHIAGSGMPCPARRDGSGLRLDGRWGYASGSPHATWAALAAMVTDDPDQPPVGYFCLVPTSDLRLEDTWHTVGMRGTGSNTYVAGDVFVPGHRMIAAAQLAEPSDSLPFAPVATIPLIGTMLGIGRAALTLVIEHAPLKSMHHTFFARQSDSVGVQLQVAEAALKLRTAQLHGYSIADGLDSAAAGGYQPSYEFRAQARAQAGYATQQVLEAIQILLNVHGAGSFAESSRMQQYWRDANTAARHAGLNAFVGYEVFGKALLNVPEHITAMV
jgi:alkylation response protein AidB-like acyl-CoA dehydrogenase